MKMKETLKRFWTLDTRHAGGFTLVELIVVIAILAILAGVAIPAYSGYITKANKQADMSLVSEVADALVLHYYSNANENVSGYVILQPGVAASGDETVSDAAMKAVFGDNWKETAMLKYEGWTNDGLLNYVLENKDSAPLIANSTYLTTATPDGLMNAATNLTDVASTVIKSYQEKYEDDPDRVNDKLNTLLGPDFVRKLNETGVQSTDEEYTTVISNMLVGHYADVLNNSTVGEAMNDQLTGMMLMYAELYAYCETINDTTTIDTLNTYLAEADEMDELSIAGLNSRLDEEFLDGFLGFAGTDEKPGQGAKDLEAALEIMGAVSFISDTYTDKNTLSNPDLYKSDSVSEQLNNYINAVKAVATMGTTGLENVPDNAVVVFVAADSSVSVIPGAAYLAS